MNHLKMYIKYKLSVRRHRYDDSTFISWDRTTDIPFSFFFRFGWTHKKGDWWTFTEGIPPKFFHTNRRERLCNRMAYQLCIGRIAVEFAPKLRLRSGRNGSKDTYTCNR